MKLKKMNKVKINRAHEPQQPIDGFILKAAVGHSGKVCIVVKTNGKLKKENLDLP